ncbi:MAG: hypothetical protein NTZ84_03240 [Candidatus Nealsonbacteria bacterium]|nr:hypothetical protein [Candidatus Nealsonbacteria bacterium]
MYPPHLLYLNEKGTIWFNPSYGINGFWNEYKKLKDKLNKTDSYVWTHRDLKRAKEIYATSIVAMAMPNKIKPSGGFINPKTILLTA